MSSNSSEGLMLKIFHNELNNMKGWKDFALEKAISDQLESPQKIWTSLEREG